MGYSKKVIAKKRTQYNELIQSYYSGNQRALDELSKYMLSDVTMFSRQLPAYISKEDKEGIAMLSVEKILKKIYMKKIKPSNFQGYLNITVKNTSIDFLRKKNRIKEVPTFEYIHPKSRNLEDKLHFQEMHNIFSSTIKLLSPKLQEFYQLRFVQRKKFKDIASETNTSINTILGRHRYFRKNTKMLMKKFYDLDVEDILSA